MADGELGELVATSLDNPVTPMVRFRSDDIIRLTRQPCGCGRTHARFWPAGRKGDETIVAGRSFVPMDIWRALEQVPETATALFQLVRPAREIDELKVRVGYDPETTASVPDLRNRVSEVIEAAVGVPPVLELLPEPELLVRGRGGKLPRVVKLTEILTLASTTAAAAALPRARQWGIGRYDLAGQAVYFEVGWDDWQRDTAWARAMLADHGVGPDGGMVIVGGMPESPWFDPFEAAARELGAPYSIGETYAFEAFRTGMYARRLPITVIFGIDRTVAEGLGDELAEIVARVPVIVARPDAAGLLAEAGAAPFIVTKVGPAVAVECPGRSAPISTAWSGPWPSTAASCSCPPRARVRIR